MLIICLLTDVTRPSRSAATTPVTASEIKEHPTSTELEDGEGC